MGRKKSSKFCSFVSIVIVIVLSVNMVMVLPVSKTWAMDCPKGMAQLDCDAIFGGWENWVPDDGCGSSASAASIITTSLTGKNNQEKAYNYFVQNLDLTPVQASVIVGVIMEEGGQNLSTTAVNPSSGAYGIAQWLGARLSELTKYATENKTTRSDLGIQLAFIAKELNSTHSSSLTKLKTLTTSDEASINQAVYDFEATFEVSGHMRIPERQANAKYIFTTFGNGVVAATVDSGAQNVASADLNCASAAVASGSCNVTAPVTGAGGNGHQLSQTELEQIYGAPGTASSHPEIAAKLVDVDFLGKTVKIHQLASGCLSAVANEIKTNGSTYKVRMMGCYRFDGNGTGQIGLRSYHTYGVACDINWDTNPYTTASSAPYDLPRAFIDAFNHHGFSWGGDWNSIKDYMHFEFNGIKP
ncbi:M15 family metallopeptidase [Candidatus Saccharibacteria bacterium]|nr:M15 family metallopeptidase [Candidatus Saccharibacteria bacterium]